MEYRSEYNIDEAITQFLDKYRLRDGYVRMQIAAIWKETLGPVIARYTKKTELKNSKLIVYITSPVVKKELMMLKTETIKQLNKKIGKIVVTEIEIR
jgi:predicted nucleic acid-binding Zn ribbon protein